MIFVQLTPEALDPRTVTQQVECTEHGAVVLFLGTVRGRTGEDKVLCLEYEAYLPMAEKEMKRIAEEAGTRWNASVALVHRLGHVEVGEVSIIAAVTTAHRADAFEASRWLIDNLKTQVPIWKKEVLIEGSHWVEGSNKVKTPSAGPPESVAYL